MTVLQSMLGSVGWFFQWSFMWLHSVVGHLQLDLARMLEHWDPLFLCSQDFLSR